MTEGARPTSLPGLDPAYATELLQQEAGIVVASLDLLGQLGRHGDAVRFWTIPGGP